MSALLKRGLPKTPAPLPSPANFTRLGQTLFQVTERLDSLRQQVITTDDGLSTRLGFNVTE